MGGMVGSFVGRLVDLALPAACAGCGREGAAICPRCLPAIRAREREPPGTPIGTWGGPPAPLLQLEWCAPFTGAIRRALHQLKYAGEQRLAEPLGEAIARRWRAAGAGGELLVHVPVHEARRRERGFDQAELLATVAGRYLRLPVAAPLKRTRATAAQYRLDRSHRAANLAGAFRVGTGQSRAEIRGRWVVLVDDVLTTGATLSACAEALLAAGAAAVSAVTVARER